MHDSPLSSDDRRPIRHITLGILLLGVLLATVRLAGYPDLMDNEQQLQSAYVMDVVQNGHWVCQRDEAGDIATKPPLYAWLAASVALAVGSVNRFTMCLPSVAATIAVALIIWHLGRLYFGIVAGAWAATAYLLTMMIMRQIGLARMDGLVPLTVILGALAAWHAWNTGHGWVWFWIAGAAATLNKTPAGLWFSAAGLIAIVFTTDDKPTTRLSVPRIALANIFGAILFVAITGGWYLAALHARGPAVYQTLIARQLVPMAVGKYKDLAPGQHFFSPIGLFLSRFAPWSFLACIGLWRLWKNPAPSPLTRRFERFVFFWFIGGLIPICIAPHQRADFLLPIYPPAVLLAGREIAFWWQSAPTPSRRTALAAVLIIGTAFAVVRYDVLARKSDAVRQTLSVRALAAVIDPAVPLTYVDAPFSLQYYRNTMRQDVDRPRAARLLDGAVAAYVALIDDDQSPDRINPAHYHDLLTAQTAPHQLHVLSNRPTLAPDADMVLAAGPLDIYTHALTWQSAAEHDFTFAGHGSVRFVNLSSDPQPITVRFADDAAPHDALVPAHAALTLTH